MHNPKVSIIVPIYKVENELDKCVQSLLNQTYLNLEIILVDDGSPDACPSICDNYAAKDNRIIVIHKENGGLSDARNVGLNCATGDYLTFIDADDWVSNVYIESLMQALLESDADIAICGYYMVNEYGQKFIRSIDSDREVLNHEEAIRALFCQQKFECMACMKLYKKYLFNNLSFPKGKLYEDIAISLPLFDRSKKCVIIKDSLYYYFQRQGSIVNSTFNKNKLDMLLYVNDMIEYSHRNNHKYDIEAESFYLKSIMFLLFQAYQSIKDENTSELIRYLRSELNKHKRYLWNNDCMEFRRKVVLTLIIAHFPIHYLMFIRNKRMEKKYEQGI